MSTAVWTSRIDADSIANKALDAAAKFWLFVAVIGQWAFLYYIVVFYGPSTFTGNFQAWTRNRFLFKGYVAGDTAGNLAFAAHALLAAVIAFGGAIQLVPLIRTRFPAVHRWNGRVFLSVALGLSVSGLYMEWIRQAQSNLYGAIAISFNAVFIITFAILAWRTAMAREMRAHRKWAMRTYLVSNAQWFFRVGLFAWLIVNRGPVGLGKNFDGPFILFLDYGCYLVPLATLELYLRAKESADPSKRWAVALAIVALTLLLGIGIFGFNMFTWKNLLAQR